MKFIVNGLAVLQSLSCFNVSALTMVAESFLFIWYGPSFPWSTNFLKDYSRLKITVDAPLSAGKLTTDISDGTSFKVLSSFLEWLLLCGLKFWFLALILAETEWVSSFSKSFAASSIVAMIFIFESILEVIAKWDLSQDGRFWFGLIVLKTLITHFFLSHLLVALCVFSSCFQIYQFPYMPHFCCVKKSLYISWWIFSIRLSGDIHRS